MKHPKYIVDALTVLRARLDVRDPGHSSSSEVCEALARVSFYIDTWVLPLIDVIEGADSFNAQQIRAHVRHDAAGVRLRRKRAGGAQ